MTTEHACVPVAWVTGTVAASLLHTTHQQVIALAIAGKLERKLRKTTHLQTRTLYQYCVASIARLKVDEPRYASPPHVFDASSKYVTAQEAGRICGCSTNSIYVYKNQGHLRHKRVQFTHPHPRIAMGFDIDDVLVVRARLEKARTCSTYEEEVVTEQATVLTQKLIDVGLDGPDALRKKVQDLLAALDAHQTTIDGVVATLRKLAWPTSTSSP